MKSFLLCAGRGLRFRPITTRIPKPLLPFLNVPLALAHLERLAGAGFEEVGVNLHHLAGDVERRLREGAPKVSRLAFFEELVLLGTAGALRNAAGWLGNDDFLLVNSDAAVEPDWPRLLEAHRRTRRLATLLLTENPRPDRFTPVRVEADRVAGFGGKTERPPDAPFVEPELLYTGVCVLSGRLLPRIPAGETALVADLWEPLLREDPDAIGWSPHEGPFADLGSPGDFLDASLAALDRGGPFPKNAGVFDPGTRVLARPPVPEVRATRSVVGAATVHAGATIRASAVWDGVIVGEGASLTRCVAAGGRVPAGVEFEDALLWADDPDDTIAAYPLLSERRSTTLSRS